MIHRKAYLIAGLLLLPLGITASACAQEDTYSAQEEGTGPTIADYFTAADADGDSALNRDEYRVFIDGLAGAGDEAATAIRDGDQYDDSFSSADSDSDGLLTIEEIGG
jgi:hypothetical protein